MQVRLTGDRDRSTGIRFSLRSPGASGSTPRDTHPPPQTPGFPQDTPRLHTDTGLSPLPPPQGCTRRLQGCTHRPRATPAHPRLRLQQTLRVPRYPEALDGKVGIGMGRADRGDPGKGTPLPSLSNPPTLPHTTRTHTQQTPSLHLPAALRPESPAPAFEGNDVGRSRPCLNQSALAIL